MRKNVFPVNQTFGCGENSLNASNFQIFGILYLRNGLSRILFEIGLC